MGLWPFGKKIRELSDELSRELLKTFGIESEDTAAMRYVSRRGRLGTGKVDRVCIFNPALLSGKELAAGTYESLMALKKGLLFTGHVMKGPEYSNTNVVVLYDQRAV